MKAQLKIIAILAVLALALVPALALAEDSDAYVEMRTPEVVREFTDNADGSLAVYVLNQTDAENTVTITVTSLDGSHTYKTQDFTIPRMFRSAPEKAPSRERFRVKTTAQRICMMRIFLRELN